MRLLQSVLLITVLFLGACSYFDSEPDKPPLEGERISIMDLQKELQPVSTVRISSAKEAATPADSFN